MGGGANRYRDQRLVRRWNSSRRGPLDVSHRRKTVTAWSCAMATASFSSRPARTGRGRDHCSAADPGRILLNNLVSYPDVPRMIDTYVGSPQATAPISNCHCTTSSPCVHRSISWTTARNSAACRPASAAVHRPDRPARAGAAAPAIDGWRAAWSPLAARHATSSPSRAPRASCSPAPIRNWVHQRVVVRPHPSTICRSARSPWIPARRCISAWSERSPTRRGPRWWPS